MSIDFPCSKCGRTLRTPESAAGRQAQCPECQAMTTVPGPTGAPAPGPVGGPASSSPFGPTSREPEPASINPYQSPSTYDSPASASGYQGPIRPGQLVLEDVFSRTWEAFKLQWGQCVVALLIVWGITFGFRMALNIMIAVVAAGTRDHNVVNLLSIVGGLCAWLLGTWLGIGMASFYLKIARGQPVDFSEIFSGGTKLVPIVLASLLVGIICFGGFLLLIVPAVIFGLMFSQFYYLIIDRNLGVMESLEVSKDVMAGNKLTLFLVWLVMGIGGAVVVLFTCFVGLLAVVPFACLLRAMIYLSVTGKPTGSEGANPFR